MYRLAGWIAEAVSGTLNGADRQVVMNRVVTDSRSASAGSAYVARIGEATDGHNYVKQAVDNGAVALIVEHLVDVPSSIAQIVVEDSTYALGRLAHAHLEDLRERFGLDVIAMTGSAGKTTTKDLLFQIMSTDAPSVAPQLSFNNEVGLPLTVLQADETTRHLVLEMGASGIGHIKYLTDIASPDVAIELMVGHAHLGGFGGVDGIEKAKGELITGSRPGAPVVLNYDDPRVMNMTKLSTGPITTFSPSGKEGADFRALDVDVDHLGRAHFTLEAPGGRGLVNLNIVGVHHVANALAAIAGAVQLGLELDQAIRAINEARALSPHRMDVVDLRIDGMKVTMIDDAYNANLDSMRAAFATLNSIGDGHTKIAVLSEMLELGDESADIHRQVGLMAKDAGVESLILLGQDAPYYAEGAGDTIDAEHVGSVDEAVTAVCAKLKDNCVILVKGSLFSYSWKVADQLREKGVQR